MESMPLTLFLMAILLNATTLSGVKLLVHDYYEEKCPIAEDIVRHNVEVALLNNPRRKDSLESSFSGANLFIPAPNSSLEVVIDNFKQQGLDIEDLVTLSGNHTIGRARCLNFRQRIYEAEDEYHHVNDRYKRYTTFRRILRFICPVEVEGRDNKFAPLDLQTPKRFDNQYFINILL
ncbi:peroxidase 20-like [Vigna radiata var. radiata]|uniref:peroxidase n=1 Tax=Vigna radiata var. radiata TaxID=3916 RepID=A0A1S3VZ50_VIGRR|nr:peroxidase 20-like [Vigna radiata var. radiata]